VSIDPLIALEKGQDDKRKAESQAQRMSSLINLKREREEDNYSVNSILRARFRKEKKERQALEQQSLDKGLRFRLVAPDSSDELLAKKAPFSRESKFGGFKRNEKSKMAKIMASSIFGSSSSSSSGGGSSNNNLGYAIPSKHASKAETHRELAVKRAKLGLNLANLSAIKDSQGPLFSSATSSGGTAAKLKRKDRT